MPVVYWMDLFFHSYSLNDRLRLLQYPNGKNFFEQDNVVIEIFDRIKYFSLEALEAKINKGK